MIFIDTGAFLARYLSRDQYHSQALTLWQKIKTKGESCFTSNFVLDEMITLLGRWANHDFSSQRATNIYASNAITILRSDQNDELSALKYFEKYGDQQISFTDCVSFVLMKKSRIKKVFTFDQHFVMAGFQMFSS